MTHEASGQDPRAADVSTPFLVASSQIIEGGCYHEPSFPEPPDFAGSRTFKAAGQLAPPRPKHNRWIFVLILVLILVSVIAAVIGRRKSPWHGTSVGRVLENLREINNDMRGANSLRLEVAGAEWPVTN
jgi:hypothetical protein